MLCIGFFRIKDVLTMISLILMEGVFHLMKKGAPCKLKKRVLGVIHGLPPHPCGSTEGLPVSPFAKLLTCRLCQDTVSFVVTVTTRHTIDKMRFAARPPSISPQLTGLELPSQIGNYKMLLSGNVMVSTNLSDLSNSQRKSLYSQYQACQSPNAFRKGASLFYVDLTPFACEHRNTFYRRHWNSVRL